jgi:hypothetical protein
LDWVGFVFYYFNIEMIQETIFCGEFTPKEKWAKIGVVFVKKR